MRASAVEDDVEDSSTVGGGDGEEEALAGEDADPWVALVGEDFEGFSTGSDGSDRGGRVGVGRRVGLFIALRGKQKIYCILSTSWEQLQKIP